MEQKRLLDLRKLQFLLMNVFFLAMISLFLILINVGITYRLFWIIIAVLSFIQAIQFYMSGQPISSFASKRMKELNEYEKDMMGDEWRKKKKLNANTQLFLVLIFMFNSWVLGDQIAFSEQNWDLDLLYLMLVLLLVLNLSIYFHNRKVDKGKIKKGYTLKTLLFGLIFGLLLFGVINFIFLTTF